MSKLNLIEVLDELEKKHNWSIYDEIYDRNKNNLEKTALFYRGKDISYGEMLINMRKYAQTLISKGFKPGMEIPVCMANIPEFVYLLGAASIIGIKPNIFGEEFDDAYLLNIINNCSSNTIFLSDDKYEKLKDVIENSNKNKLAIFSLCDSLPKQTDPYIEFDKEFYDFKNKIKEIEQDTKLEIISNHEFIECSIDAINVVNKYSVNLDDEFTTTYSSGSTNSTKPKGIVHKVRSYITMGRFHDPEVSGTPSMKNLRVLAHIPTHSNTNIQSCITDSLIQGSTVCLEPIYRHDFFLYSLLINKPNFPCATRSFWVYLAKQVKRLKEEYNISIKFPFLLAPMSVGEPLSKGEEKLANKMCRMTDAGIDITHTPKSVVSMSVAGGDCEHGGIFFIMFRKLMGTLKGIPKNQYDILGTYSMVDIVALDENDKICEEGEIGRLYASSPCNMKEYKNNPEATKAFFKEINGKVYGDCSVHGYIGKSGYIHIKGRINQNSSDIPPFRISEEILEDTKKILSCEVIEHKDEKENLIYVAHIEFQPSVHENSTFKVLKSALQRCENKFGKEVSDKIIFRVRSYTESFPLTGCGKRNNIALKAEGIENCIRPIIKNNYPVLSTATDYLEAQKGYAYTKKR